MKPFIPLKPLKNLTWESHFVDRLPGDGEAGNFTRQVKDAAYSPVQPTPVRSAQLLGWSDALATELGIRRPDAEDPESVRILGGNLVLPGMRPYSARYGGHQFGSWAGQLGDGRAITLGEITVPGRGRWELQLKGAGPTPYSRRADGRAVLRSSLREFLCSEAMHFLGVPTTRALSLVTTGEEVIRDILYDGNPAPEPGAIVCRVSPSFLRFGNFQILASGGEHELLRRLADLVIQDFFPELDLDDPDVYGQFLDEVSRRTARMVAHWMRVGFVHGVMNTDNMSILGLTIDYGPYGWLEPYDPNWTPNTTDAHGRRYRFGHQPAVAQWNLARLCEAFLPLVPDQARLYQSLEAYRTEFETTYTTMLAAKLGLRCLATQGATQEGTPGLAQPARDLVHDLFELLGAAEQDYTLFFRALCDWTTETKVSEQARADRFRQLIRPSFYPGTALTPALESRWIEWSRRYTALLILEGQPDSARRPAMQKINPKYVLRNYLAQNAITAATQGDASAMERLLRVLTTPYDEQPGEEDLAAKRPEWARNAPGCSALSCSS